MLTLAASLVAAQSSTQPSATVRRQVAELSTRAADLIDQHKFDEAEKLLREALVLSPQNSTCLYNLACVHAATGQFEAALADLRRATDAGFTDFNHLENDPVFRPLHETPGYQRLLAEKDEIRHRAAQRILANLKSKFGAGYVYEMDEPHKLVLAVYGTQATLDDLRDELRVEAHSQWEQIFSHKPDEFIRVVVAKTSDFGRTLHRPDVGGYYDDTTRTVLVKRTDAELRHEFTHALHAADQHALGQEHPVWLSEGLATLYEYPRSEGSGPQRRMVPNDTPRLAAVQNALRHHRLISLEHLVTLDRSAFTARAELAYGESGELLLYLYEHDLLKRFYDAYTAGYAQDHTGRVALEKTTGPTLDDLQTAWTNWLRSRPLAEVKKVNANRPGR